MQVSADFKERAPREKRSCNRKGPHYKISTLFAQKVRVLCALLMALFLELGGNPTFRADYITLAILGSSGKSEV